MDFSFLFLFILDLGLEVFPASEPAHIIAPIGTTFLRQRAAQMKVSSKHPRVKSSTGASMPPSSDPTTEEYVDPTTAINPSPFSSNDASLHSMLDTVMTVQAAHGQILVDVLTELQALRADLASARRSSPPPPFDDEF